MGPRTSRPPAFECTPVRHGDKAEWRSRVVLRCLPYGLVELTAEPSAVLRNNSWVPATQTDQASFSAKDSRLQASSEIVRGDSVGADVSKRCRQSSTRLGNLDVVLVTLSSRGRAAERRASACGTQAHEQVTRGEHDGKRQPRRVLELERGNELRVTTLAALQAQAAVVQAAAGEKTARKLLRAVVAALTGKDESYQWLSEGPNRSGRKRSNPAALLAARPAGFEPVTFGSGGRGFLSLCAGERAIPSLFCRVLVPND